MESEMFNSSAAIPISSSTTTIWRTMMSVVLYGQMLLLLHLERCLQVSDMSL